MNILVAAPSKREYANACRAAEHASANNYTVIKCGIGKAAAAANVARALSTATQRYDAVAVVGYAAGTLGFHQGEIVMPDRAMYHDCDIPDGFVPEITDPRALAGKDDITVFTGDSFVNTRMVRDIKQRFGIDRAIFDMEITAIAIAAEECGNIPVVAVKMISDVPEEGQTEHSYDEFVDAHADFGPLFAKLEKYGE